MSLSLCSGEYKNRGARSPEIYGTRTRGVVSTGVCHLACAVVSTRIEGHVALARSVLNTEGSKADTSSRE
jgi:hypothetical protein